MSVNLINGNATRGAVAGLCVFASLWVSPPVATAGESEAYSISRGGRLYDKWFKESKPAQTPKGEHPGYPKTGKYLGNKGADWRCKECHGWDYRGDQGVYKSGKHFTGIKGIQGMAGSDPERILAVLRDETHSLGQSGLTDRDYRDLALFVSRGQVDSSRFIDASSKSVAGNKMAGQGYYETVCANCHGLDGKEDDRMPPLGKLANDNPWEVLHKVINGQPNEEMPSLRAFDLQVGVDILAYLQTLPQE
jgi:hypothetical protein